MYFLILCFKVTFVLHIQVSQTKVVVTDSHIPKGSYGVKRDDFKSVEANKIDIVLKLNNNKDTECSVSNNGIDRNSLNNLLPQNNCEDTTTPTACEEITTLPSTTNCDQTTEAFTCIKEGTFGDPSNCDEFFICHRKSRSDSTLERIKLTCPKGTAFDKDVNKCTKRARILCLSKREDPF